MAHADPDRSGVESAAVGDLLARLTDPTAPENTDKGARSRAMRALGRALASSARSAGRASVLGGRWLTELLIDAAPRIPMRDRATLRAQHGDLPDDDLAETLISGAAKATATVGAAGGALAAVQFAAPPTLLSAPAQVAAETLLVAAIEMKLIAELHEIYGAGVAGSARERGLAYLWGWTNRRGIDPLDPSTLPIALGGAAKRAIRNRLVRRAGRNLTTLGPLLSGAVAGSIVNHRETRRLAHEVRQDLRPRS